MRQRPNTPISHSGRVVDAATGELLRELTIDSTRDHQPTGRSPGRARKKQTRP